MTTPRTAPRPKRSSDLPQTADLAKVRAVVGAVSKGLITLTDIQASAGDSERAVAYALGTARFLGWVVDSPPAVSPSGRLALATAPGSQAEASAVRKGLIANEALRRLAVGSLEHPPSADDLTRRIRKLTDLAEETARRRAQTLRTLCALAMPQRLDLSYHPPQATEPGGLPVKRTTRRGPPIAAEPPPSNDALFLTRCRLKDFRSIADCDVQLRPLTLLVGPNGAGKSNFLDALRLVSEALSTTLEHALGSRGGIHEVRRRSSGHPRNFGIALDLTIGGEPYAYRFEVGAAAGGGFRVTREQCVAPGGRYEVRKGVVVLAPNPGAPPATPDRLYLVTASGLPAFRPLYDALSRMGFYNVQPDPIRELQSPDQGELLSRDAHNLASVIRRMQAEAPDTLARVKEFVRMVVPGIQDLETVTLGHKVALQFRQQVQGSKDAWQFPAITMSDGTLRAVALLVALFQPGLKAGVPLVGIEEPETALHPAAAGVLFDALRAATRQTQVVVTTHSPELLDHPDLDPDEIRAVIAEGGTTTIGPLDDASIGVMRERLYTGGELLRAAGLDPAPPTGPVKIFENLGAG